MVYTGLTGATVFAILMGAQRTAVVATVISVLAFAWMASIRRTRVFRGLLITATVGAVVAVSVAGGASAVLGRYESILPSRVLKTTYEYRAGTIEAIPEYIVDFPLGTGLGSVGPAASLVGGARGDLNAESQFTYLLIELGIPGLVLLLAFTIRLVTIAYRRVRTLPDGELRVCLAAAVAPLIGQLASWFAGPTTAGTPGAPYFWFTAGLIAYWAYANAPESQSPS
jgi:O-antigen ligase